MSRSGTLCESSGYYRDDAQEGQSQAPEIEPEVFPGALAAVAADRAIDGLLFYGMAAVRAAGGELLFRLHRGTYIRFFPSWQTCVLPREGGF